MIADSFSLRMGPVLALVCLAATSVIAQSKPITYSSSGGSAKQVLADLSLKTGLKLQANPQTQSEFLYINVKDVSRDQLLDHIAWSVWGSWKKEGNTYTLVRTDSDRIAAEREAIRLEIEAFRKGLSKKSQELTKLSDFSEEAAKQLVAKADAALKTLRPDGDNSRAITSLSSLVRSAPVRRLMLGLITQMTPEELAKLPSEVPVVFSNRPTRMQRGLGSGANGAISRFLREESAWREAARTANLPSNAELVEKYGLSGMPDYDYEGEPNRLLFEVRRSGRVPGSAQLRLFVTNAKGDVVAQQREILASEDLTARSSTPSKDVVVQLTEAEVQLPHSLPNLNLLDDHNLNRLLAPDQNDPLSLFVSPVLNAYCRAKKINMVASLPDEAMTLSILGSHGRLPASQVEKCLDLMAQSKAESGLTSWRTSNLSVYQSLRSNRQDLRAYYRRHTQLTGLTLDEKGDWAVRLPITGSDYSLVAGLAEVVHRSATGQKEHGEVYPEVLRLFGSLNPAQRKRTRGDGLSLNELTKSQVDLLAELTYGADTQFQVGSDVASFSPLMSLPTEVLPDGIPSDLKITLSAEPMEVISVSALMGEKDHITVILSPGACANYRVSQKRPDLNPWVQEQRFDLEQALYGKVTHYTLTIRYNDQISQVFQFEEKAFPRNKPVRFDQLPESFLSAYRKAYQRLEEDAKNATPPVTPTTTSPPPRT